MNILLSCAGRRNYLVNYFRKALNGKGKVIATDMQLNAPALVDADLALKVPAIYDPAYIDETLKICKENNVQLLISLNDLELPILAKNKPAFAAIGVNVIVSDSRVIDICFDKWKTTQYLQSIGVNTPLTFINVDEALQAIEGGKLQFPLVVKPRWGSASIGIEFPESVEEFKLAYQLLSLRLHKTILAEASKEDADHAILIQQKIDGQEYGMDVLNDFAGNFVQAFPKRKLAMRAGETDKSVSVDNAALTGIGKTLGENLRHIGNLDCDVFETKEGYYVLELNPRFGGGYPFTYEAGADFPATFIEWGNGGNNIAAYLNFKPGQAFSKCDRLMSVPNL